MKTPTAVFLIAIVGSSLSVGAPAESKKKVLILGAGVTGITAAKTLHDKGIDDFLVLEGQDYIGGRLKNVPFAGQTVEAGANWIQQYQAEDNPITELNTQNPLKGTFTNYSAVKIRYVFCARESQQSFRKPSIKSNGGVNFCAEIFDRDFYVFGVGNLPRLSGTLVCSDTFCKHPEFFCV